MWVLNEPSEKNRGVSVERRAGFMSFDDFVDFSLADEVDWSPNMLRKNEV